jgi:cytochrome c oxidase assembly protein subunit 11
VFDITVNPALPWKFRAVQFKQEVRPGEITEALFIVENESDKSVVGQAIPSVAPEQASLFFNKTECFCFINQVLAPGEKKEMIVRFVVDSDLPEKISTMTLSYTFFKVLSENDVVSNVKHETTKKNNGEK